MTGYKGIIYRAGILRSKGNGQELGDIFELGVPKQKAAVTGGIGFSEMGYSLCSSIEAVLPWMDYLKPLSFRRLIREEVRLFEVGTLDGKTEGSGGHIKAETLVIKREIPQREIIAYFEENQESLNRLIKSGSLTETGWKEYCRDRIEDYALITDAAAISRIPAQNCLRNGQKSLCLYPEAGEYSFETCKKCPGFRLAGDALSYRRDYLYLQCRRQLIEGKELELMEEFTSLRANGFECEVRNLRYLADWISGGNDFPAK